LTYGTDVTDYEVGMAATLWINSVLYADLDLANGLPHRGVGSGVEVDCRVGSLCAYPHPNQPRFNRIQRNMLMQIEGTRTSGGTAERTIACSPSRTMPDGSIHTCRNCGSQPASSVDN
jgi:hypothetical protein